MMSVDLKDIRNLTFIIAIHEFVGCLAFPNELRLLSPKRFVGFVIVLLRSALTAKNYFNGLFEGFWILIVHYPVIVRIDKTSY